MNGLGDILNQRGDFHRLMSRRPHEYLYRKYNHSGEDVKVIRDYMANYADYKKQYSAYSEYIIDDYKFVVIDGCGGMKVTATYLEG